MKKSGLASVNLLVPATVALVTVALFAWWLWTGNGKELVERVPGTDHAPGGESGTNGNAVLAGKLIRSSGKPSNLAGAWPQFRGPDRNAISKEPTRLSRNWEGNGPRELWGVD